MRVMLHNGLGTSLLLVLIGGAAFGQAAPSLPSKEEIFELVDKADQKVSSFEATIKQVRLALDKADTNLAKNYLDAASTAHWMIQTLHKNGPSGYALVGLLATLDDLSLDAMRAAVIFAKLAPSSPGANNSVMLLTAVGTGCNDVAELIMHATLRFIQAEEKVLELLLDKKE